MKNMDNLFKELAEAMMEYKKLEKAVDDMKADIKRYMEDNKLTEYVGKEHKVTYKEVSQTKIDRKKLEAEHPRIAKKYTVESSYMRLNFT